MKKYLFIFILSVLAVLMQLNIFNFLSFHFGYFNSLLVILVVVLLLSSLKNTLICALIMGYFLDLYSVLNFGIYTATLLAMIVFIYYFFQKYLTNRSLYSFFILTGISTLFYYLVLGLFSLALYYLGAADYVLTFSLNYFGFIIIQIISNSFLAGLIYLILNYVSDKLKSNFILKDHYYGQR